MTDLRQRSLSEPGADNGAVSNRGRSGKLANITVDELGRYARRRRPSGISPDNLHLLSGSFAALKSEYMRRFRAPSLEALQRSHELPPIYRRQGGDSSTDVSPIRGDRRPDELTLQQGPFTALSEYSASFLPHALPARGELVRINSNLESPGPVCGDSEQRESYRKHEELPRRQLVKHTTKLKLEGDLQSQTEYNAEFVPREILQRISKSKKPDEEMKLEESGKMRMESEYQRSYSPEPFRKSKDGGAHLKLEGDFELAPESKENFEKLQSDTNLKPKNQEKGLVMKGTMAIYPDPGKENADENTKQSVKLEGDFQVQTDFKKDQHKIYPIERSSMISRRANLNIDGRFDTSPDYQSRYKQYEQQRGKSAKKTADNINLPRHRPPTAGNARAKQKNLEGRRLKDDKPPFEGPFECQPEYRKARMDMLIKERPPSRKKFEPDMTLLPPLHDRSYTRPPSRVSSPTFKLRVVPPSPANKHTFVPNAIVSPIKSPRRHSRPHVEFARQYRSTDSENTNSEDENGRAFVVLDQPLPGTRRKEKSMKNVELCKRSSNWMPLWYDRIQR